MIESIIGKTKKIIYKFCEKHSVKNGLIISDVRLLLGLDMEGNTYTLCLKNVPERKYSILEVLGVPFDITPISSIAPTFIAKSIMRFSEELGSDPLETQILCIPYQNEHGKNDVALVLYNGVHEVRMITWSELFRVEDIEIPT